MSGWRLAIDFGTTYVAAAVLEADGQKTLLEIDGSPRFPSMVFLSENGQFIVGEAAESQSALAPERLERTPKDYLGRDHMLLGGQAIPVVEAVGAVLTVVAQEALRRHGNVQPASVRLTFPASWGEQRRTALIRAARLAGIEAPQLVSEPEAAATHLADESLRPGEYVAVYDLGGGTFDTAVLERTADGFRLAGRDGRDRLGGEAFDRRVYELLLELLEAESPETVRQLHNSSDRAWRHARADLRRQARKLKEELSRYTHRDIYLPAPIDRPLRLTREELEELIREDLEESVEILDRTITRAGLDRSQIAGLYLTGGSSRIPLVANLLQARFHRVDTQDDPKAVVVLGAVGTAPAPGEAPLGSEGRTEQISKPRLPTPQPPPAPEPSTPWYRQAAVLAAVTFVAVLVVGLGAGFATGAIGGGEDKDAGADVASERPTETAPPTTTAPETDTTEETTPPPPETLTPAKPAPTDDCSGHTDAEESLCAHIPAGIDGTCARLDPSGDVVAGFRCEHEGYEVVYYGFEDLEAMDAAFDSDLPQGIETGDCDETWAVSMRYERGDEELGQKACYDTQDGQSFYLWTDEQELIYAYLRAETTGAYDGLRSAWEEAGPDR